MRPKLILSSYLSNDQLYMVTSPETEKSDERLETRVQDGFTNLMFLCS